MNDETPPVTVLLYHNILPVHDCGTNDKGSIVVDRLIEHINALKESGFEFISLEAAFALLVSDSWNIEPKKCVLTFDDAMEGLHRFLPELLPELKIPITVFVITDYVGQLNLWNTRSPVVARHMSLSMLLDLQRWGVDLQLHGVGHHNLIKFSEPELGERFGRGITWFKNTLGYRPKYLAYPYGSFNTIVQSVVTRYFQGALSVNHGMWWGREARFGLNRISVPFYFSGQDLVDIIFASPKDRWIETEKRAPWMKNKEKGKV